MTETVPPEVLLAIFRCCLRCDGPVRLHRFRRVSRRWRALFDANRGWLLRRYLRATVTLQRWYRRTRWWHGASTRFRFSARRPVTVGRCTQSPVDFSNGALNPLCLRWWPVVWQSAPRLVAHRTLRLRGLRALVGWECRVPWPCVVTCTVLGVVSRRGPTAAAVLERRALLRWTRSVQRHTRYRCARPWPLWCGNLMLEVATAPADRVSVYLQQRLVPRELYHAFGDDFRNVRFALGTWRGATTYAGGPLLDRSAEPLDDNDHALFWPAPTASVGKTGRGCHCDLAPYHEFSGL